MGRRNVLEHRPNNSWLASLALKNYSMAQLSYYYTIFLWSHTKSYKWSCSYKNSLIYQTAAVIFLSTVFDEKATVQIGKIQLSNNKGKRRIG